MTLSLTPFELETLTQLETSLWQAETRFDLAYMEAIVAEDFYEFGRSGRTYDRAEILIMPDDPEPILISLPLAHLHWRLLSADVVQVTYDTAVEYDGVVEYAHRCSLWTRSDGGWQIQFHQGTPFTGPMD